MKIEKVHDQYRALVNLPNGGKAVELWPTITLAIQAALIRVLIKM